MEAGDRDKLDELLDLTRENNKILRAMHRRFVWGQVFTVIYWMIILGVAGWAYYYFQPYIEQYIDTYKSVISMVQGLEEKGKALPSLQNLLPGNQIQ